MVSSKKIIKRLVIFIIIAVISLISIITMWPRVDVPYTHEEMAANNKDLAISNPEYEGEDCLTFVTDQKNSAYYDGYKARVYFTGVIHNSTEDVIESATLTFGFTLDRRTYSIEVEFEDLLVGENTFVRMYLDEIYRNYSYTNVEVETSVFYRIGSDTEYELCNTYMDPENPPEKHNSALETFATIGSCVAGVTLIIVIITIISLIKNRLLTEHVSSAFFEEETQENKKETKKNTKSEAIVYCKYCGGEFDKVYTKCPDCGARLIKNNRKK